MVVHEFGHYTIGRVFKFNIVEFAIGMGPRIVKTEKGGIIYSLRALPIGGFVQFYGEDSPVGDGKDFRDHPVRRRAAVIAAGPIMNILFAFILAIMFCAVSAIQRLS